MTQSTRFALGVHVLSVLATRGEEETTASDRLALSVNTNPVVIRQLLSRLREAALVTTRLGKGGGARLARSASEITLRDVYLAVEDPGGLICTHHSVPSDECPVGRHILAVLEPVIESATDAMLQKLEAVRISDVAQQIAHHSDVAS